MRYYRTLLILSTFAVWCVAPKALHSQVSKGPWLSNAAAQSFSEAQSLERAKEFVAKEILENNGEGVQYSIEALHAATSGELTTLKFECKSQNKSGLILAFWGNFWLESGVEFKGYGFKYMPTNDALKFLNSITSVAEKNDKYLKDEVEINHISLLLDDLLIQIWINRSYNYQFRILWGNFDSQWNENGLKKSIKRLEP